MGVGRQLHVGVGAIGEIGRDLHHLWAVRGDVDRHRRRIRGRVQQTAGHRRLHLRQVRAHLGDRWLPGEPPQLGRGRVRDADAVDEPPAGELRQRPRRLRGRNRVATVDVGDTGGHLDRRGVVEEIAARHVDLAAEHVGNPHGVVAERLETAHVVDEVAGAHHVGRNDDTTNRRLGNRRLGNRRLGNRRLGNRRLGDRRHHSTPVNCGGRRSDMARVPSLKSAVRRRRSCSASS